ncbi:fibrobacter succinogenes major paralogous domain-containing protein [Fibrobacter sp.]|uniref:fibrobacter succinogenes major paralogous domain-containing protein n=1 Tax=Fibrobacter sp. TaxID=35828 RepID=UPI00389007AB
MRNFIAPRSLSLPKGRLITIFMLAAFFALSACDDSSSAGGDETGVSSSSVESSDSSVTLSGASAESNGSSNETKDKSSSSVKGSEPVEVSSSSAKESKNSSDSRSSSSVKSGDSSSSSKDKSSSSSSEKQSSSSLVIFDWSLPKETYLNPEIDYDTIIDSRDGKVYRTVKIGEQTWMAENLNYDDSVATPSLLERSWCYDNKNENCGVTGRLYTWAAAIDSVAIYKKYGENCGNNAPCDRFQNKALAKVPVQGICPDAWHLPSRSEWLVLYKYVGDSAGYTLSAVAGLALKSKNGWVEKNGTDVFGFSALPAGWKEWEYSNLFLGNGYWAVFWNSNEDEYDSIKANFTSLHLNARDGLDVMYIGNKYYAMSVRCVKDSE